MAQFLTYSCHLCTDMKTTLWERHTRTCSKIVPHYIVYDLAITERNNRVGSTPVYFLRSTWFIYVPEDRVSWLRIYFFQSPQRNPVIVPQILLWCLPPRSFPVVLSCGSTQWKTIENVITINQLMLSASYERYSLTILDQYPVLKFNPTTFALFMFFDKWRQQLMILEYWE